MSNREKYIKQHQVDRTIRAIIDGQPPRAVYLARRKVEHLPHMGDKIHVKDIDGSPWVPCRVIRVEDDLYHLKFEPSSKPARPKKPIVLTTANPKPKELRVKAMLGQVQDSIVIRGGRRPKPGDTIKARPIFESSKLPAGWLTYKVINVTTQGNTIYHLQQA